MLFLLKSYRSLRHFLKKIIRLIYLKNFPKGIPETRDYNGIKLTINSLDPGGTAYFERSSFEEVVSPLYALIKKEFNPTLVIDVGANYGFTSCIYHSKFPNADIIAIEPSNYLCSYIKDNIKLNNAERIEIIKAVCDSEANKTVNFSLNPVHSQDNRVIGASKFWQQEIVKSISLDEIIKNRTKSDSFIFIKIDVQGYEEKVFSGAKFLNDSSNWLIKAEFSPNHLKSQGTDPEKLLRELVQSFDVVENLNRVEFKKSNIDSFFMNLLTINDVPSFTEYVMSLNTTKMGWTDLLIRPKTK